MPVDTRSDLFSFGVVLHEMLAGSQPFQGATSTDVLVAILEREPAPLTCSANRSTAALSNLTPTDARAGVAQAPGRDKDTVDGEDIPEVRYTCTGDVNIGASTSSAATWGGRATTGMGVYSAAMNDELTVNRAQLKAAKEWEALAEIVDLNDEIIDDRVSKNNLARQETKKRGLLNIKSARETLAAEIKSTGYKPV